MGYKLYSKYRLDLVLRDTSNLISIITDVVILHEDLAVTLEIVEAISNTMSSETVSGRQILLENILLSRVRSQHPDKQSCIGLVMHGLSYNPDPPPLSYGAPYVQSMERDVVIGDGHSITTIGARKNNSRLLSRSSNTENPVPPPVGPFRRLSSPPPPDISDLPPPAMSRSQVLKYFENSLTNSPEEIHENDLTASQERHDLNRQMYRAFPRTHLQPVKFDISGSDVNNGAWSRDNNHEGEWSHNDPLESFKRRPPLRGGSLDIDRDIQTDRKLFRQYSSSGNILESSIVNESPYSGYHTTAPGYDLPSSHPPSSHLPSSQYPPNLTGYNAASSQYQPRGYQLNQGHNPQTNHSQVSTNLSEYSPSSGYGTTYMNQLNTFETHGGDNDQVISGQRMTRRASANNILNTNTILPPNNTFDTNYTKDLQPYTNSHRMLPNPSSNTSTTWGGGDVRQTLHQLSRDKSVVRPLTSSGASAVGGSPADYWICKCNLQIKMDQHGCEKCDTLAPFIDIGPWKPEYRATKVDKVEMDSTSGQTTSKSRSWECPYCWALNHNNGTNVCSECKSDVKI